MLNVTVPCKIGDQVWCIRRHNGGSTVMGGIVSEIRFDDNMELVFSVKYIAQGKWGKKIFPTYEAAMEAINGQK